MDLVHITTCTNRKKMPSPEDLLCRTLPYGNQTFVAEEWIERVLTAPHDHIARNLYCGRGFMESMSAARMVSTDLWVISAGLGLVKASERIPSYSLTISPGFDDSIGERIKPDFQPSAWWRSINKISGRSLTSMIENDSKKSMFLISLTQPYAPLVIEDILNLNAEYLDQVRIVGLLSIENMPKRLQTICLPYDTRINDPTCCPGTMSDFAQRTALHFVKNVWVKFGKQSTEFYSAEIKKIMESLKAPIIPKRRQLSDLEVCHEITINWDRAQGISNRMLRILRDDLLVACEQKRFSTLFKQVKEGMN